MRLHWLPLLILAGCAGEQERVEHDRHSARPFGPFSPPGRGGGPRPGPAAPAAPLPPAEPAPIPGPMLEYRFEEGEGDTIANTGFFSGAHGTRHDAHGAGEGPVFSAVVPPTTASTRSLWFDGANDWVRVPDDFDLTADGSRSAPPLTALTIEAWIRADDVVGQRVVWDDYGNPGALLAIWDGAVQFAVSTAEHPGLGAGLFGGTIAPGTWTHIAGVYDGHRMKIFVNGRDTCARLATSGPLQDNSTAPGGGIAIGIGADNETIPALNFAGAIDELRIHARAVPPGHLAAGQFGALEPECAQD